MMNEKITDNGDHLLIEKTISTKVRRSDWDEFLSGEHMTQLDRVKALYRVYGRGRHGVSLKSIFTIADAFMK